MTGTWLCATDFTGESDAAALEAARLVAALQGELVLLHVHPIEHVPEDEQTGERTWAMELELRRRLDRIAAALRARHPGVKVRVDVAAGEPVRTILEEVARSGADRLVVGTRGRRGLAHVLLGSIAERLVHDAPVPVFVVKGAERLSSSGGAP